VRTEGLGFSLQVGRVVPGGLSLYLLHLSEVLSLLPFVSCNGPGFLFGQARFFSVSTQWVSFLFPSSHLKLLLHGHGSHLCHQCTSGQVTTVYDWLFWQISGDPGGAFLHYSAPLALFMLWYTNHLHPSITK